MKWYSLIENISNGINYLELSQDSYLSVHLLDKIIYKIDHLGDTKEIAKNELKSGLLNFIKVLDVITGNNGNLISKEHLLFEKIILKKLLVLISSR